MTTIYLDCETLPAGTLAHVAAGLTAADAPLGWTCPPYPDPPTWVYGGAPKTWKDPAKIAAHRADAETKHARALADHEAGRESWEATARERAWTERAKWSLDPLHAEIACLGYAVDDGEPEIVAGPDVLDALDAVFARHDPAQIVAHNARFDAEMLWARAIRAGRSRLAGWLACWDYRVSALHRLHRGPRWIDTMDLLPIRRDGAYRYGVSQADAAELLGVGQPHPLRGADVLEAVLAGRIAEVHAHCRSDVIELRDIHRRLWAAAEVRRG